MSPQCHTHRKRNIRGIFTTNGEGRSSEGSTEQGKKFMGFDKTIAFWSAIDIPKMLRVCYCVSCRDIPLKCKRYH